MIAKPTALLSKAAALGVILALASTTLTTASTPAKDESGALAYAFRFASALDTDPKDKGRAQESVILELAQLGRLEEARDLAGAMSGWRRGVALADLAALFAKQGREQEARKLIEQAKQEQRRAESWRRARIGAHVAQALAELGDLEGARSIAGQLSAADRQYAGRAIATVAAGLARKGRFREALRELSLLDDIKDIDVSWWRTVGYMGVARTKALPEEQRLEALDAARRSADGVPGWKRAEALRSVAAEYLLHGKLGSAKGALDAAVPLIEPLPASMPIKLPLMGNLTRGLASVGEKERARALLDASVAEVDAAMLIERPAIHANLAVSYLSVGDAEAAHGALDRALAGAEGLVNARPRALAVVTICRTLARHDWPLDEATRTRLDALYAGLGAPW